VSKKRNLTKAQRSYKKLVEEAAASAEAASQLQEKYAPTCKHPHDLLHPYKFEGVEIGVRCDFCGLYGVSDDGPWTFRDDFLDAVKKSCKHPIAFIREFTWEHDNGYGRQKRLTGKECSLCRCRNYWDSQHWSRPEDYQRSREYDY
jgi:hypothetical protein